MHRSVFSFFFAIALPALPRANAFSPQALAVCDEIHAKFPSNLAYAPSSPGAHSNSAELNVLFKNASMQYWNAINDVNVPACALFPACAEEVSAAVIALNKQPDVPFALKSGGHNWNTNFSSTDGGVLISFRPNLQSTVLSADGETAKVGPGSRWVEAMQTLDKSNKCIVGGRDGDVGVGGYLTQGGISYLSAQYGFAADNVVEYEFVTPNGTILTVNENSHTDIFWALHGGGNAFGIVTMYTLQTHDIDNIWGGRLLYSSKYLSQYTTAITNFIANNKDAKAAITPNYYIVQVNQTDLISVDLFYDGPNPPAEIFDPFLSIPSLNDTTKVQRYPELLNIPGSSASVLRVANGFNSFPNLAVHNMTSFLEWQFHRAANAPFMKSPEKYGVVLFSMALQPMPVMLQQAARSKAPGAALSPDPANGDKIWIEYDMGWINQTYDDYLSSQLIQVIEDTLEHHKNTYAGVEPTKYVSGDLSFVPYNPLFMNDSGFFQNVLRSYGNETYNKLKALHKQLDPKKFMTSRQHGWFFNESS